MLWLGAHFPGLPLDVFTLRDARQWERKLLRERSPDRDPERHRDQACSPCEQAIAPTGDNQNIPRVVAEDNRIVLCNSAAAALGVVRGSSLATAHSIASGLVHYRRSHGEEAQRLRRLGETLYQFSSQVSLIPPNGVVLEIGASLRLFGDAERLTAEATAACEALGHETVCRTAATPLAAFILARADTPTLAEVPLRLAAMEPEQISPTVIEQLGNMGIHTLGQLLALPAAGLAMRFGQSLVDYLQRLTGDRPDPRPHLQPSPRFRRRLHLLSAIRSKEVLLIPMTQLLTELQHWLVAHQLGVEQLLWRFAAAGRNVQPVSMPVQFSTGQQRSVRLLEISRLELERTALPEEVIDIGLRATRLRPWQTGSQALFRYLAPGMPGGAESSGNRGVRGDRPAAGTRGRANRRPESGSRLTAGQIAELGALVDRLEARLGRGACWSLEVRDQHVPEAAWQRVAPLRAGAGQISSVSRPPLPAGDASALEEPMSRGPGRTLRPAWLFVPPRRVRSEQLTLLRGPERIESGWWRAEDDAGAISRLRFGKTSQSGLLAMRAGDRDQSSLLRDYYVARLANGAECWVFRDAAGHWFLHGYFG